MKFKEVKTYQSVRFGRNEHGFFSTAVRGLEDISMEEVSWGIRIKSPSIGEDLIISFNNVAYAKILEEVKSNKKAV